MAYFIKWPRPRPRIFIKSGPRAFRKGAPYTEINCMSQKLNFDKFEGADFKFNNSFLKFQPKNTQRRHFWSLGFFIFKFALKISQLDQLGGVDLKYCNIIFKF